MKIQCNCGTKYSFDVTPEMAENPVTFLCQNCGADNSLAVNILIQQQFPATATEGGPPPAPAAPPPPPAESAPRMKVAVHVATPAKESESASGTPAPQMCRKHPGHFTSEQCRVCNKPICPQCMILFGYVCSAFCKNEAETRGIELPVYANQAGVAARRETRKLGKIIFGILGGVSLLLGVYVWYLAAGSRPHVVFAAPFKNPAFNGGGKLYERDLVVLHGGRLARFDWKDKKEIWGVDFIDMQKIDADAAEALVQENAEIEQWKKEGGGDFAPNRHTKEEFARMFLSRAQSDYTLHVHEQNLWLRSDEKLVQYDWATGKPGKEVALQGNIERTIAAPEALLIFAVTDKGEDLLKMDWKSGELQTQPLRKRLAALARTNLTNQIRTALATAARTNALTAQRGTPANPALKGYKVAQPDPLQMRLAAPAVAANAVQNKRIERAIREDDDDETPLKPSKIGAVDWAEMAGPQFILDRGNVVEFSTRLLERKIIERQAMKAPPKKSALEGNVNQAATVAIANEIFNDFQREATGGLEKEDVSRYEVTIKRTSPDASETRLEVIGEVQFFPLQTVDLLIAGKTLHVLDKAGKKLWESKLNFDTGGGFGPSPWGGDLVANASAPGVERDNLLYFFDQGVLACFELATGNARWRQPTVGVTKLLFDDKGMLYVDTTTGSADKLKYSQQVDISDKSYPVIIKIDPKTGKAFWRSERHGRLSHVFGKLVYTMEWHGGDDDESPTGLGIPGAYTPPHIRLRRLSASNGEVKWEYYQKRAPLNVDIQNNTIQLVFKKELQVLKFIDL